MLVPPNKSIILLVSLIIISSYSMNLIFNQIIYSYNMNYIQIRDLISLIKLSNETVF